MTRLVVPLNARASVALNARVKAEGGNKTTIIHRALQVYAFLAAYQDAGGSVELIGADGSREKLRLM